MDTTSVVAFSVLLLLPSTALFLQASLAKEDLSDMVAEHAAKQSSKRKRMATKDDKDARGGKKYKEFKF